MKLPDSNTVIGWCFAVMFVCIIVLLICATGLAVVATYKELFQ